MWYTWTHVPIHSTILRWHVWPRWTSVASYHHIGMSAVVGLHHAPLRNSGTVGVHGIAIDCMHGVAGMLKKIYLVDIQIVYRSGG